MGIHMHPSDHFHSAHILSQKNRCYVPKYDPSPKARAQYNQTSISPNAGGYHLYVIP
ncbi:hypothetical protein [Rubritalea tangerina]|uniref:hypothetical protein n=1 Tax=Rubritalea tangerina TaxID=430798 RepID=UPI0036177E91